MQATGLSVPVTAALALFPRPTALSGPILSVVTLKKQEYALTLELVVLNTTNQPHSTTHTVP